MAIKIANIQFPRSLEAASMNKLASANILIVEDEKIVAWDIKERLESLGYQIAAKATSGEAAIASLSITKPDLVLMDIQLPGLLNGIETAQIIYDQFNIPVVYLTAHSDNQTLAAATQTNPFGYILKPFQSRELHSTIQIALQRHEREMLTNTLQQWLANTLNSLGDATITTDRQGCITFMNPIAEQLLGWSQDDALGQPIEQVLQLISLKTREVLEIPVSRSMALNQRISLTEACLLRSKLGTEVYIQDMTAPILTATGETIGSVITLQDITQQEIAQLDLFQRNQDLEQFQFNLISQISDKTSQFEQLNAYMQILVQLLDEKALPQSSDQRLDWILRQLSEVMNYDYAWIATYDEHRTHGTVSHEYFNESRTGPRVMPLIVDKTINMADFPDFYQVLFMGVSWVNAPQATLPSNYATLLQPEVQLLICPLFVKQVAGKPPVLFGEVGIMVMGSSPWTDPLQVKLIAQVVSYAASLSRQAELSAMIQSQTNDLASLSYLQEDFISSVSHELKTPLDNMNRSIHIIQHLIHTLDPMASGLGQSGYEQNQVKLKLINYLQSLEEDWQLEYSFVNDLLNFNSPVLAIEPMHLSMFDMQSCCAEMVETFSEQLLRFNQTFSYEIRPQRLMLYSHRHTFQRILKELFNNAVKYTPPNQRIDLSVELINGCVELALTNTGITIPETELESIFKPFYRIPRNNPWDYCGTGLGLALVRRLASRLGAMIKVKSAHQVTTFVLTLPQL
jgi:PAS domain S-box-containing protein